MNGWISIGAGVLGAAVLGGCRGDRCASSDLECFLNHMVLVEPTSGGAPMPLRNISRSTLPPTGGAVTCTGALCNGVCVNPSVAPDNCGGCGLVCMPGQRCAQGACVCAAGRSQCSVGCFDLQSDPTNCGSCGNACGSGYCSQGACVSACGAGRTACGNACVDLQSDARHCGACAGACGAGETCQAGACACTSPTGPCGCADLATDPLNCGACGSACAGGQACVVGVCGGGGAGSVPPSISNQPAPLVISEPSELQALDLDFDDPQGCTPAFCAHLCDAKFRCSSGFMCTQPKRDSRTQGVWRSYLGFLAEPTGEDAQLTTGFVPVSAPGCPDDLLDRLASGTLADIAVGVEVKVEVTVALPASSSGGGGQAECSPSAAICGCAVNACATSDGTCWYEVGGGRVDCAAGCDCQGAAASIVSQCCPH
jgi:hypothetical protein